MVASALLCSGLSNLPAISSPKAEECAAIHIHKSVYVHRAFMVVDHSVFLVDAMVGFCVNWNRMVFYYRLETVGAGVRFG